MLLTYPCYMLLTPRQAISSRAIEWPTVALIAVTYGGWVMAGLLIYPVSAALALTVMAVLNALHSSLVHEVIHGHPTRSCRLNMALVIINPAVIWPYHRFRRMHLRHHADERLTDPFDDPESYYRALYLYDAFPAWAKWGLGLSNTLIGRLILGPPLSTIALIAGDLRAMRHGEAEVIQAWALHLIALIPVVFAVVYVFGIPFWLYCVTACYGGAAIISLRTFAEHQWHETPDGRTIIVEHSPLSILFLNNNLHLVHHKNPTAPWYELPQLYKRDRARWRRLNDGYVYRNYWQLFRAYAVVAKEPVAHPAWYRSKDSE